MNSTVSLEDLYLNVTKKLVEDYNITFGQSILKVGINKVPFENHILHLEVKQIITMTAGLCYAILPINDVHLHSNSDSIKLSLKKHELTNIKHFFVQMSTKQSYYSISLPLMNGIENPIIDCNFKSSVYNVYFQKEDREYVKKCSRNDTYQVQ